LLFGFFGKPYSPITQSSRGPLVRPRRND
jgi:hypothetical protein